MVINLLDEPSRGVWQIYVSSFDSTAAAHLNSDISVLIKSWTCFYPRQYFQFAIFAIFERFSIGNIFNLQYLQCLKGVKPLPSVVFLSALTLSFLTVNQETSIWHLYREVLQKQKTEFRMLYPLSNELTCVCNVLSAPPILEVFRKIYPNLWI